MFKYTEDIWNFIKKHQSKVYAFMLGLLIGIFMVLG